MLENIYDTPGQVGGLRKTKEAKIPCLDSAHNPPTHMCYEPGEYEYTCPSCGHVTKFKVPVKTC